MSEIHGAGGDGSGVEVGTTDARQGHTLGRMRYVLAISTILVIVGFCVAAYIVNG